MRQPATLQNTSSSSDGRCAACLGEIPIVTRFIMALNICIFIYKPLIYNYEPNAPYAMSAVRCIKYNEWYRIITSTFLHGNYGTKASARATSFLHIGMNMFAAYYLMGRVEKVYGSLSTFGQVILFTILGGFMYVFLYVVSVWIHVDDFLGTGVYSVGYSGVLFSFMMSELATLPAGATRSFCGFCNVPAWVYPWMILVLLSLANRQISLVGHLSGILVGYMYSKGWLNIFTFKRTWLWRMESWECWQKLMNSSLYHKCPLDPILPDPYTESCYDLPEDPCSYCESVYNKCCGCLNSTSNDIRERTNQRRLQRNQYYEPVSQDTDSTSIPMVDVVVSGESAPWTPGTTSTTDNINNNDSTSSTPKSKSKSKKVEPPDSVRKPHHSSRLLSKMNKKKSNNYELQVRFN